MDNDHHETPSGRAPRPTERRFHRGTYFFDPRRSLVYDGDFFCSRHEFLRGMLFALIAAFLPTGARAAWRMKVGFFPRPPGANQQTQIYNSGSGNWTVPAGCTSVLIETWGGGGGGGAAVNWQDYGGSGGGGGGYASKTKAVSAGNNVAYSVGSAGAGGIGSSSAATDGSASTCDGMTANGGNKGLSSSNKAPYGGGLGGTASGGSTNTSGSTGQIGKAAAATQAAGGNAAGPGGGAGASGVAAHTAGGTGNAPGGGGGGASSTTSGVQKNGGNGAAGRVKFTW